MKEYFDAIAQSLSASFHNIEAMGRFTKNPDVIGAYAETVVNEFLRTTVSPLKVSSGTIVSPDWFQKETDLPQIDSILWDPNPIPAIFSVGDFGLIPRNSVVAALEIKRTDYSKGLEDISNRLGDADARLPGGKNNFLGVVCVRTYHKADGKNRLSELLHADSCCYLLEKSDDTITVNPEGIYRLINFLGHCRRWHKQWNAQFGVNYPKE